MYIAVHRSIACIPKCPGVMSHLITFEAIALEYGCQQGLIATWVASAQANAQVSRCGLSLSLSVSASPASQT